MRDVSTETEKTKTGRSAAASSREALYFHLVSPHFIRRLAQRLTDGGKKYGTVRWRQGINDEEYIRDRFNHLFDHLLKFMESGNAKDDNLGAMAWGLHCLTEVERLAPEAFVRIVGSCDLFGDAARAVHEAEMEYRQEMEKHQEAA